jgi:hypothetical protein
MTTLPMGTLWTNGFRIVKTIKASKKKTIGSKFKKHILHRFAKLKIKDISKAYCQKMINEIADTINSVNDIKIQANQVFQKHNLHSLTVHWLRDNDTSHL